jgi:microcystin-dependent protein
MADTPYMNLTLPTPTDTDGPEWAEQLNAALETIDAHDHSIDKGTAVPAAGLDIDTDLDFQMNAAVNVQSVDLESQPAALEASKVQSVYSIQGDLWFNNSSGTPVQITQGNSIASASSPLVPTGVIWSFGGASAPTGFLMCDGSAVSRATYSDLYAVIGDIYGAGDGSTTFNLPTSAGRAPIGAGTYTDTVLGSVTRTLGQIVGAAAHVMTIAEMPGHNHGGGAHSHKLFANASSAVALNSAVLQAAKLLSGGSANDYTITQTATAASQGLSGVEAPIPVQGSSTAFNNMQPSFVVNFIIKT